eukprot:NODE_409_length_1790_cov_83.977025_g343_i0.p1 GENE.NODE_409_length_1790_cov_83.977025_g343_i0~~NODE_409_length_1790_cov_83.977025_g343_i0.p1  ORF type:complete len:440 (+),score=112.47 NODE_409_length_1790_cov_83.977025_g343_i0:313-1632(+)
MPLLCVSPLGDSILCKSLGAQGLVVPGGPAALGVVGCILGGCVGPTAPTTGLAADHIIGFTVVTSRSEIRTASATTNADLYWALRGGGSAFAVVLDITFRAYDDHDVTSGYLVVPVTGGSLMALNVLSAYNRSLGTLPTGFTAELVVTGPKLIPRRTPGMLIWKWVMPASPLVAFNTAAGLQRALGVNMNESWVGSSPTHPPACRTMVQLIGAPPPDCNATTMAADLSHTKLSDYLGSTDGARPGWRLVQSAVVRQFGLETLATMVEFMWTAPSSALDIPELYCKFLGGPVAAVPRAATAFPHRTDVAICTFAFNAGQGTRNPVWATPINSTQDAKCLVGSSLLNCTRDSLPVQLQASELLIDPEARASDLMRSLSARLRMDRNVVGEYYNDPSAYTLDWPLRYFGDNYQRLLEIKQKYDPDQMFRGRQTVGSESFHLP